MKEKKSLSSAIILATIAGPVGLLYVDVMGAVISGALMLWAWPNLIFVAILWFASILMSIESTFDHNKGWRI